MLIIGNDGSVREKFTTKTPLNCAISCELFNVIHGKSLNEDLEDFEGTENLVELLLEHGADPNFIPLFGSSSLEKLFFWWNNNSEEVLIRCRKLFFLLVSKEAMENSLGNEELKCIFRKEFQLILEKSYEENKEIPEMSNKKTEQKVRDAINNNNFIELILLIPKLKNGVNTWMKYGCRPLMYAIHEGNSNAAEFLIQRGARLEDEEREYTALLSAAENGNLKLVQVLLKYGANITGEFSFNKETAYSIAAFKFCCLFINLLRSNINFEPVMEFKIRAYQYITDISKAILKDWATLFTFLTPPNIRFGDESYYKHFTKECVLLFDVILSYDYCLDFSGIESKLISDIKKLKMIYELLMKKLDTLNENSPTNDLDEFLTEDEDNIPSYKIEFVSDPKQEKIFLTKSEVREHVKKLNEELKGKSEKKIDWKEYPNFFIAQYRGLHYYRNFFSKNQRADHRKTLHLNRIGAAPAVYSMSSLNPMQHQLARESIVRKNKNKIIKLFAKLNKSGKILQYWGNKKRNFKNKSDMLQQRMSNAYAGYKKDIMEKKNPISRTLYNKKIIGYPHYATSDLPFHALKYAYGQKRIKGLTEWRLRPRFQADGKPLHPYRGKVFISLYSPLEMRSYRARHVAGMRKRRLIDLDKLVTPERETGIPGAIKSDASFYEELLEIPSFEIYEKSHIRKYGIDNKKFLNFKREIHESWNDPNEAKRAKLRKKIKTNIIEKTIMIHKEKMLLKIAQEEAKKRGGYLIYRHFNGKYGLQPEGLPLPGKEENSSLYERERKLLFLLGDERFKKEDKTHFKKSKHHTIKYNVLPPSKFSGKEYSFDAAISKEVSGFLLSAGLKHEPVPGDGHCLYYAVGLYLGKDQKELRLEVAEYIENDQDQFLEFIEGVTNKTISNYIRDIKNGKEWADNIEIVVLARIFQRPIVVVDPNCKIRNSNTELMPGEPIFVYYNGHNHYDGLLKYGEIVGTDILNRLKFQGSELIENVASPKILHDFNRKRKYNLLTSEQETVSHSFSTKKFESSASQKKL